MSGATATQASGQAVTGGQASQSSTPASSASRSPGRRRFCAVVSPPTGSAGASVVVLASVCVTLVVGNLYVVRIHRRNAGITREIVCIEGEDMGNAMHRHRRDEPGIMHLYALHGVRDNDPPPFRIDRRQIGQEGENTL